MVTSLMSCAIDRSFRESINPRRLRKRYAFLICLLISAPAFSQTIVESRQTYELVAKAAIETLPAPLRSWFTDRNALKKAVFTKQQDRVDIRIENQPGQQHFTWLQRPAPTKKRNRQKTRRSYTLKIAAVNGQAHTLAEMIQEQYAALTEAFHQSDATMVSTAAGQLMHKVIDASLPSHVAVVEHDWQGPLATKSDKRIERLAFHESNLLDWQRERFAFELRIWPKRLQEVRDIPKMVSESLFRASSAGFQVYDNTELAAMLSAGRYEGVVVVVRGQLEAAAILSGSLIRSAWREAGSPGIQSQAKQTNGTSASQTTTASTFVGSKQSKIFHRHTCPYVKRIKPENLVYFDSVAKSRQLGRKACKTCKPANGP